MAEPPEAIKSLWNSANWPAPGFLVGDHEYGVAVLGRAISLWCERHALFDLGRMLERRHARDDRPLVQRQAEADGRTAARRPPSHLESRSAAPSAKRADLVRAHPRLEQRDAIVDPPRAFSRRRWSTVKSREKCI